MNRIQKRQPADLSYFGADPLFCHQLHVGHADARQQERFFELAQEAFNRRRFTNNGPLVRRFERQISKTLGVAHCVTVCNASIALQMLVRAIGMGGRVVIPSFTFVATAHSLRLQGIDPVFCDISPDSHNLDPDRLAGLLTSNVEGVIGVHLWGRPCNVQALTAIAGRRGIPVIFDAAQAFGVSHGGTMVGNFGSGEVLSFHATKFLHTFEGGAIVTNDGDLADRLRLARNHGFQDYDRAVIVGTNGKMSEISAAMGLAGLEDLERSIEINRERHLSYERGLESVPGLSIQGYPPGERSNYQYVVVDVDPERCGLSRDQVLELLHAENVLARRYFAPGCHRMEPYRSLQPEASRDLPVTEHVSERVLVLPTGRGISDAQVEKVCELLRFIVSHGAAIATRMQSSASSRNRNAP